MKPLAGKVAVVAGATRGAGRGIATALGEAGATVYCTGRSVAGSQRPLFLTLLALTVALPARAVSLDEVRRGLAELRGAAPITARVVAVDSRSDGKEKGESRGTSIAEDDGTHIRLIHEKKGLRRRDEKNRGADHTVGAAEAAELLNFAPELTRILDQATLKRVSQTSLDGKPATLFEIVPLRVKDEDGDKWIKNYSDTLLLWTDASGFPLAARRTKQLKARIVVVGFEMRQKDDLHFVRANDRLVVTKRTTESSGAGLGQNESGIKTIALSITAGM